MLHRKNKIVITVSICLIFNVFNSFGQTIIRDSFSYPKGAMQIIYSKGDFNLSDNIKLGIDSHYYMMLNIPDSLVSDSSKSKICVFIEAYVENDESKMFDDLTLSCIRAKNVAQYYFDELEFSKDRIYYKFYGSNQNIWASPLPWIEKHRSFIHLSFCFGKPGDGIISLADEIECCSNKIERLDNKKKK